MANPLEAAVEFAHQSGNSSQNNGGNNGYTTINISTMIVTPVVAIDNVVVQTPMAIEEVTAAIVAATIFVAIIQATTKIKETGTTMDITVTGVGTRILTGKEKALKWTTHER